MSSRYHYDPVSGQFCSSSFSGTDWLLDKVSYSQGRTPVAIGGGYLTPTEPDTLWDKLAKNLQGGFFDPARRMSVPDGPPAGSNIDPARWVGYVDGITYGGIRSGVTLGLAGLAVGGLAAFFIAKRIYE